MTDSQRSELERLIQNVFLSLCEGEYIPDFKNKLKPRMSIEDTFNVASGKVGTDILIHSSKMNLAFLIEIKNLNNSENIKEDQIRKYLEISADTLSQKGLHLEPTTFVKEVAYCSNQEQIIAVHSRLNDLSISLPVLEFDTENFRLKLYDDTDFKLAKLKSAMPLPIDFHIDDWNKVREHIAYSVGTPKSEIFKRISRRLIDKRTNLKTSTGLTVDEICKQTYSLASYIWDEMDSGKKNEIKECVSNVLNLFKSTFPGKIQYDEATKCWKALVYDTSGEFNPQMLSAFQNLIQSRELDRLDEIMTLF